MLSQLKCDSLKIKRAAMVRITQRSDDELLIRMGMVVTKLLDNHRIDYMAIGSCATLTYLSAPLRLPRDLDLVIRSHDEEKLNALLMRANIRHEHLTGRILGDVEGVPFHILISSLKLLDPTKKHVLGTLQLEPFMETRRRNLWVLAYSRQLKLNVPCIEILFVLNLMRQLNTNTIIEAGAVLENVKLDHELIRTFLIENPLAGLILAGRLERIGIMRSGVSLRARSEARKLSAKLSRLGCFRI
jgi:hypothetical protein